MFLVGSSLNFLNVLYQLHRRGLYYKTLVNHYVIFASQKLHVSEAGKVGTQSGPVESSLWLHQALLSPARECGALPREGCARDRSYSWEGLCASDVVTRFTIYCVFY